MSLEEVVAESYRSVLGDANKPADWRPPDAEDAAVADCATPDPKRGAT